MADVIYKVHKVSPTVFDATPLGATYEGGIVIEGTSDLTWDQPLIITRHAASNDDHSSVEVDGVGDIHPMVKSVRWTQHNRSEQDKLDEELVELMREELGVKQAGGKDGNN